MGSRRNRSQFPDRWDDSDRMYQEGLQFLDKEPFFRESHRSRDRYHRSPSPPFHFYNHSLPPPPFGRRHSGSVADHHFPPAQHHHWYHNRSPSPPFSGRHGPTPFFNSDDHHMIPHHRRGHWPELSGEPQRFGKSDEVVDTKDKFQIKINVHNFTPEELTVKTVDQRVTVEGKHEENNGEVGFVSRHFTRSWDLPEDINPQDVVSTIDNNGMLTVEAPRNVEHRIPIQMAKGAAGTTDEEGRAAAISRGKKM